MNERLLPAYPIFVKDPFYSIWATRENLNDNDMSLWTGEEKKIYGLVKIANKWYSFLGNVPNVEKAMQTKLSVSLFKTEYEFSVGEAILKIAFTSPLDLNDKELLSMPVCYMQYETENIDDVEIAFIVNRNLCYNDTEFNANKKVTGYKLDLNGLESAVFGLAIQHPLSNIADAIGADWGYWYLNGEKAYFGNAECVNKTLDLEFLNTENAEETYALVKNKSKSGIISLAFDDRVSIEYFGEYLKGYYLENHTVFDGINFIHNNYEKVNAQLQAEQDRIYTIAKRYGETYVNVMNASYRQSVGAHKLVHDTNGELLFLSKECNSNGCIGTVDVSYPSIPLYAIYDTEYIKGMMRPIFKFNDYPVWEYDFAPHDVGTYPHCAGQVYGVKEDVTHFPIYQFPKGSDIFLYEKQMPVEECADMIIMLYACYYKDNDISFYKSHKQVIDKWVVYLEKYALKPENQLCTDDFAGHLKNNLNLAIKGTIGIACYAQLEKALGNEDTYKQYRAIAESFVKSIEKFGNKFRHLPLTWDNNDSSFSLKYNLAFDKVLRLNLFSNQTYEKETACYQRLMKRYGTPLDSRKEYTKSDWLMWTAVMTEDEQAVKNIIGTVDSFLKYSEHRVPFSDWYDTITGEHFYFQARTVQGGCFILLMRDLFELI